MFSINPQDIPVVANNHISVRAAAQLSGYSLQYLRRLLRTSKLVGLKIGQIWLVDLESLLEYLNHALTEEDQRFNPK